MATVASRSRTSVVPPSARRGELARADTRRKDEALRLIAAGLPSAREEILDANEQDMRPVARRSLSDALLDRLSLDESRIEGIASAVLKIVALADPVGEVIEGRRLANGLDVRKVRVPLGVVAVVYEARPNVTIDAAALCLKSGNAIVLRGSSSALHSNAALARIAADAVVDAGLPEGCVGLVAGGGREELGELATQSDTVDLDDPARRRGPEGGACRLWQQCPSSTPPRATVTSMSTPTRTSSAPRRSCSTQRCSARAYATPPRRCSCTSRSRESFLPREPRLRCRTPACSCARDERAR